MRLALSFHVVQGRSTMKIRPCSALLVCVLVLTTSAFAQDTGQPPPVELSHLEGNLYQLRCDGNVGVIASVGEDGILLVDTGYARTAETARLIARCAEMRLIAWETRQAAREARGRSEQLRKHLREVQRGHSSGR